MDKQELVRELANQLGVKVKFEEQEEQKVKVLERFDPAEEIKAGRYVWDEELQLGKLTRLYQEPRFDYRGRQFALASFQNDNIDYINAGRLPDDCFVPTMSQMDKWNKKRIGEDWVYQPEKVLQEYGVKLYGDAYAGVINNVGYRVYLASASRDGRGRRYFLVVDRNDAGFLWLGRHQCGFVPVFFGAGFLAECLGTEK